MNVSSANKYKIAFLLVKKIQFLMCIFQSKRFSCITYYCSFFPSYFVSLVDAQKSNIFPVYRTSEWQVLSIQKGFIPQVRLLPPSNRAKTNRRSLGIDFLQAATYCASNKNIEQLNRSFSEWLWGVHCEFRFMADCFVFWRVSVRCFFCKSRLEP